MGSAAHEFYKILSSFAAALLSTMFYCNHALFSSTRVHATAGSILIVPALASISHLETDRQCQYRFYMTNHRSVPSRNTQWLDMVYYHFFEGESHSRRQAYIRPKMKPASRSKTPAILR